MFNIFIALFVSMVIALFIVEAAMILVEGKSFLFEGWRSVRRSARRAQARRNPR